MNDGSSTSVGWFVDIDPGDVDAATEAIREGNADDPQEWSVEALEEGFADDEADYFGKLREATIEATREAVRERERADDQQLVHAVRAADDCERVANELVERVDEWAGSLGYDAGGVDGAREVAALEPTDPGEEQLVSLAGRAADLADEADQLRAYVESRVPGVAPNLSALAGPVLAARLLSLAGGLEALAKMPSGTVQVLGAEDALFAHLRGQGSSPKHGAIFTHEYVRGTRPDERGSAARALAGKLTIAARIDHYSGERRPELDEELDERIRRIRSRGDGGD
jgi:nucleolar protein 56